ncbi:MAG: hypothetical protein WCD18_23185, partial [Thermosynechococcaceae cyanobacterium]
MTEIDKVFIRVEKKLADTAIQVQDEREKAKEHENYLRERQIEEWKKKYEEERNINQKNLAESGLLDILKELKVKHIGKKKGKSELVVTESCKYAMLIWGYFNLKESSIVGDVECIPDGQGFFLDKGFCDCSFIAFSIMPNSDI